MPGLQISWYTAVGGILLVALMLSGSKGAGICERANARPDVLQPQLVEARMTTIEVEIDIFSGMPNPQWTLSQAHAAMFLSKLSGLQKSEARSRSARLGYRGLVVRVSQGADWRIFVQNGVIESSDGTTITFFLDSQRSLERWLIGTGRKFLSHEVIKAIDADLQQ